MGENLAYLKEKGHILYKYEPDFKNLHKFWDKIGTYFHILGPKMSILQIVPNFKKFRKNPKFGIKSQIWGPMETLLNFALERFSES